MKRERRGTKERVVAVVSWSSEKESGRVPSFCETSPSKLMAGLFAAPHAR